MFQYWSVYSSIEQTVPFSRVALYGLYPNRKKNVSNNSMRGTTQCTTVVFGKQHRFHKQPEK